MNKKETYTEAFTYMVDMLDNGITLAIPEADLTQVEKFAGKGGMDDENAINFLGKHLWQDISAFADYQACNSIRISITLSKNE